MEPLTNDMERRETTIAEVRPGGEGWWAITDADGWSFGIKAKHGKPEPGQPIVFFGRGLGYPVRGVAIDGRVLYYKTAEEEAEQFRIDNEKRDAELRATFEANRAKEDARYDALPEDFRRRLDKFRKNNPDFRWKYEGYEMFCCEQAVVIASALKTEEAIRQFDAAPYDEQRRLVPGLSDGHSGNTFGAAVTLALLHIKSPENVVALYGALAPLVGSEEYGCVPKEPHGHQ